MGNLKGLLSTSDGLSEFRDKYNIPRDVQIRALLPGESVDEGSREAMPFPTIAIVKGRWSFSIRPSSSLVPFIRKYFPLQCAPNLLRIVMGVVALNRLLGISLEIFDILSCYYFIALNNQKSVYYLKSRDLNKLLVHYLSNSNKPSKGDFIIVSGNWEVLTSWGGVRQEVPRVPGSQGRPIPCPLFFINFLLLPCIFFSIYLLFSLSFFFICRFDNQPDSSLSSPGRGPEESA